MQNKISYIYTLFNSTSTALLVLILIGAAIVQSVYFIKIQSDYPSTGISQENQYSELAGNFKSHGIYGTGTAPDIERDTQHPPLYSMLLSVIYAISGSNHAHALIVNNLYLWLMLIIVFMAGAIIDKKVGVLAALLTSIDPSAIIHANSNEPTMLNALLIALLFLILMRLLSSESTMKLVVLGSFVLALSMLTCAITLYLLVPIIIIIPICHLLLDRQSSTKRVAIYVLILASFPTILVGGWITRNYAESNTITYGGVSQHIYSKFLPAILAEVDEISFKESQTTRILEENIDHDNPKFSQVLSVIAKYPLQSLTVSLKRLPVVFFNYPTTATSIFLSNNHQESIEIYSQKNSDKQQDILNLGSVTNINSYYKENGLVFAFAHKIIFNILAIFCMFGTIFGIIYLLWDRDLRPFGMLAGSTLFYLITISAIWPSSEFRLTLLPIYTIPVAFTFFWLWDRLLTLIEKLPVPRTSQ